MNNCLKISILLVVFLCFSVSIYSQSQVFESLSMQSKLLKTNVKYSVYLPDGYKTSKRHYPIVYLLNGFTGGETDWIQFGNLQGIADETIEKNDMVSMIIVMPDGGDRLYMNKADGTYPYEDMFIKEFVPFIENTYRVRKEKQFRGIAGLSMGGFGAIRLALKHSSIFGSCAGFSSAIVTDDELKTYSNSFYNNYFGRISEAIKGLEGKDRITKEFREYDLLHLVKNKEARLLKSVHIYFDCGDDDFLSIGNAQLHIELKKRKIPHQYRVRNGTHNWEYWRTSLSEGLKFISKKISR